MRSEPLNKEEHAKRVEDVFQSHHSLLAHKTERLFAYLFIFQWLLGIAFAIVTPSNIFSAIFLGGLIAGIPVFMISSRPGGNSNQVIVAVSQMIFSGLLIHLTGGRVETHFHVFVSLGFLAFYRDFRPILVATFVTILVHLLGGYFWPQSIYGVADAAPWRAVEYSAWVLFEDFILLYSISLARAELRSVSEGQVNLEEQSLALQSAHYQVAALNNTLEERVLDRTKQLQDSQLMIVDQQQALIFSSKMSALGELAGGIAHEINTPLTIIGLRARQIEKASKENDVANVKKSVDVIVKTVERIAKTINGLRIFGHESRTNTYAKVKLTDIIEDTLSICGERIKTQEVYLELPRLEDLNVEIECQATQVSQILLNLLNNACDAILEIKDKWIRVDITDGEEYVKIDVTDCGNGIPKEIQDKLMEPFFTTKEVGKGTGLGLSISRRLIESQQGKLFFDNESANTKFTMLLRKKRMVGEAIEISKSA